MNKIVVSPYEKRFVLTALILLGLAYAFWTGSRYPALNEKAMMSGAIQLEDPLGFEALIPLTEGMSLLERMFYSTINWVNTNKKGMTFGILFAAAFLTLASYLKQKSFRGGFSNSVLGLVIGTPLGVCVNCAAPIARGMYSAGLRAETTLSAMIASPTLNIVVLTMLFSLLPFYMVVTKIVLSLLIILIIVPLICRVLPQTQITPEVPTPTGWSAEELAAGATPTSESLVAAVWGVVRTYVQNLWYIIKLTVPLMLLAGALGAIVATLIPEEMVTGLQFSLMILILMALVGVFLPVPIAFDVVVTGALISAGLEQGYVMTLLFTLGTFSIYSFFIVAQSVGWRAAWLLGGSVALIGVLSGLGVQRYHQWQTDRALELLIGDRATPHLMWAAQAAGSDPWQVISDDAASVTITATPFAAPSPAAETVFERLEAWEIGIDKPLEFGFDDMWPPFWEGRSLSSADFDRDGDIDLAVASTVSGLYLYANDGTGKFSRVAVDLGPLADVPIFHAVLVDIDNDGWRDLFLATYRAGNHLMFNRNGRFSAPIAVANRDDAVMTMALSFADPDRDGDLDVALGNWASGWYRRIPGEESRNRILWNQDGALTGQSFLDLPGIPGETLSILFSDADRDGDADLLVGNDFEIPDYLYLGDGAGGFQSIRHQDGMIPHTTTTTMAIKTADLFNDGAPEIYLAQIAGRSSGVSNILKMQPLEFYCDTIKRDADRAICERNMDIKTWYKSGNNFDPTYAPRCQTLQGAYQAQCKAMLIKDLAIQRNDASVCRLIPADQPKARSFCELHFKPARKITAYEAEASIQQILRSNVLLEPAGKGFADTAESRGLDVGGWSWDTKIADYDHDGWQDVYIVNGTWVPNEVSPSNLFFHNGGDGSFTEKSGPFGLEDYLMTAAATQFDMDGDGDLDMVTHPVNGPLTVFRNTTQAANAVIIALVDDRGNRDGIGAVIELVDEAGQSRMRELQLGGGFMSFDAAEAHFGLGASGVVDRLVVTWADGSVTEVSGPLHAGQRYLLHRQK